MFWKLRATDDWKTCTSDKERFSAAFPGNVERQFQSLIGVDDGESPGTVLYSCDRSTLLSKCVYRVAVTRVLEYFGSPEDFLQTAVDEMMSTLVNANLMSQQLTSFENYPAIQFQVEIKGFYKFDGILVLVSNTLYNVAVFFSPSKAHAHKKFIDSFHILMT
jgi:hypothetical protein